jgi:DNA invertase Pin-like site-specific DNA recombinase
MLTETTGTLIKAAQYVRMSTDQQKYSVENQSAENHKYAASRQMKIVQTYADKGKSGLTLDRRDALKRLIDDVQSERANFKTILVYDVSRWGRFQDSDESAYYEYICKRAGISVNYCAEQFNNDGTPLSDIIKSIRRAMAGEYSRELSTKTFAGQCRVVELGYRMGGAAGFGLRRMLVDQNGIPKGILAPGEFKCIASDRLILVPGPPEQVERVRWIFTAFVRGRMTEFEIATALNRQGVLNDNGRPWNRHAIRYMLRNEKYIGNNVWNRASFKLQRVRVRNTPEMWLRAEGAFESILSQSLFDDAQAIFRNRPLQSIVGRGRLYSDDKMLEALRRLLRLRGYLTKKLIDESEGIQSGSAYTGRFGSLSRVYQLIDYKPERKRRRVRPHKGKRLSDEDMLAKLRELLQCRGNLSRSIIEGANNVPSPTAYSLRFGGLKEAYNLIGFVPQPFRKLSMRPQGLTDEQLLDVLRKVFRDHGHISQSFLYKNKDLPSYFTYHKRFGGLALAYKIIGYAPER